MKLPEITTSELKQIIAEAVADAITRNQKPQALKTDFVSLADDDVINAQTAQQMAGVSRTTMQRWRESGRLISHKETRRNGHSYRVADVRKAIEATDTPDPRSKSHFKTTTILIKK